MREAGRRRPTGAENFSVRAQGKSARAGDARSQRRGPELGPTRMRPGADAGTAVAEGAARAVGGAVLPSHGVVAGRPDAVPAP